MFGELRLWDHTAIALAALVEGFVIGDLDMGIEPDDRGAR